jgi:hypothetical protein
MTSKTLASLLVGLVLTVVASAQALIPKALREGKTVYLINDGAKQDVFDDLANQIKTWGRWTLVDDAKNADLTMTLGGLKRGFGWPMTVKTPDGVQVWGDIQMRHYRETAAKPLIAELRKRLE